MLVSGGPDLGDGSMAERLQRFRGGHARWRRARVTEARANDVLVGALLCEPQDAASNRLDTWSGAGQWRSFSYDVVGNLASQIAQRCVAGTAATATSASIGVAGTNMGGGGCRC